MIKSLKRIPSLAVFKGFEWDAHVIGEDGHPRHFKKLNIIYGRNYSGKTSLSRIFRALETKVISDKYISPEFTIELEDSSHITNTNFQSNTLTIRVFNEDFIKENLKFMVDPTEELNSFAVIGERNIEIEENIKPLEQELGIETKSEETGLYAKLAWASRDYTENLIAYDTANNGLTNQLSKKATDPKIGIKYKSDVFGDQNYTKPKLEADIATVLQTSFVPIDEAEKSKLEILIKEKQLDTIPSIQTPSFALDNLKTSVSELAERKVGQSDKIESLIKDAVLNKWVQEGVHLHKDKDLQSCSFCGNEISSSRWTALEKHFDEESKRLETDIDLALQAIQTELTKVTSLMRVQPSLFYVSFHSQLNQVTAGFDKSIEVYTQTLDSLKIQLEARKKDILNSKIYSDTAFSMVNIIAAVQEYEAIIVQSNKFTDNLSTRKKQAQEKLRLKEVFDFAETIDLSNSVQNFPLISVQFFPLFRSAEHGFCGT